MYAHFYGLVTYEDGTKAVFETSIDDQGRIFNTDAVASADALAQIEASGDAVQNMLDLLLANIPDVNGNQTGTSKTVTGVVAKFHGRVTNADGTWEDFSVQYDPQNSEFVPNSGGISAWSDAYANYQTELGNLFTFLWCSNLCRWLKGSI